MLGLLYLAWALANSAMLSWASSAETCLGYHVKRAYENDFGIVADLELLGQCSSHSSDVPNLRLVVEYQTSSRLRVLIEDAEQSVYQIPTSALSLATGQGKIGDSLLTFNFTKNPFSFSVARVSTGEILFDTAISPLIFESQYIRLQTRLPRNPNIYGLGEHSDSFRLPTDEFVRTFWNAESPYIPHGNLYGSHPVYFEHRSTGTHGVFLANSNGMDVNISKTQWTRYLEYSILGGVLDFYFLAGPDPTSVSQQYAELVGLPAMIPYWTLGFHQCKYGWPSIDHVSEVVVEYSAAQIPLEAIWGDIDYMDRRRDFTTDPKRYPLDKVRAFVDQLHRNGQRYVQILDPGIHNEVAYGPYDRGAQQGVFLRSADGSFYRGRQWPGEVVWPDWLAPGTEEWWINEIRYFYNPYTGIDVDGLWVDMNEASNMCLNPECVSFWTGLSASMEPVEPSTTIHQAPSGTTSPGAKRGLPGRDLLNPRYRIGNRHGSISTYTLATNITNADGTAQYDTHNLYGSMMAAATRKALLARRPNVRPFVLTRSTFAGTGRIAAHWFGDNNSTFAHYLNSISQLLTFSAIHAMPLTGSDVCGFNGATNPALCARWTAMAAFHPFMRNHADITSPDQELYRWPEVAEVARWALDVRYRLLDYLYTAFWRASTDGRPVIWPLWFWYPEDERTWGLQTQWGFGEGLLVSPVVEQEEAKGVVFYLPKGVWYDFWSGERVVSEGRYRGAEVKGLGDVPVHIRGGWIIPLRVQGANTTAALRRNNFELVVAPGEDGTAKGELYLDDGETLDVGDEMSVIYFWWDGRVFEATGVFGYETNLVVESVLVLSDGVQQARRRLGPWGLRAPFKTEV